MATNILKILICSLLINSTYAEITSASIGLKSGKSDNLGKTKFSMVEGSYLLFDAALGGKFTKGENDFLFYVDLNKKKLSDSINSKNFDTMLTTTELAYQRRFSRKSSFVTTLHILKASDRELDFAQGSTAGRDSKYLEIGLAPELVFVSGLGVVRGSIFYLSRNYSTLSNDENNNLFEDDYKVYGTALNLESDITNRLLLKNKVSYERKRYEFRRSRFTEGTLDNGNRNPLQELINYGYSGDLEYTGDFIKSILGLNYNFQDDRVLGALDYDGIGFSLKFEIPIGPFLEFKPTFSYSKKDYEAFVADVINNPQSTIKRKDYDRTYALPIEASFGQFKLNLEFSRTRSDSNYTLEGFHEKKYEFGVTYEFI